MIISVDISDGDNQEYEKRVLMDRHENASDILGIHEMIKKSLAAGDDPFFILKQIQEITYREYGGKK